jgi:putative transcriptional regulator
VADPKTPRPRQPQDPQSPPAPAESPEARAPSPEASPEKSGRSAPSPTSLTGQLLIAMPQMQDPRFARTVIYLCAHGSEGAMGLVVNKYLDDPPVTLSKLMGQLGITTEGLKVDPPVHRGGPVEEGRGFVLHSADYTEEATMVIGDNVALTATLDILRAIGRGEGPKKSLLALGYAGWGPGQLDAEMQANGWLHVDADEMLVFDPSSKDKWQQAIAKIGIDLTALSGDAGHA